MLSVFNITRRDPLSGLPLLHPANLHLRGGEHGVILGASGSGKSLLLRSLGLLDTTDGGELLFLGKPVEAHEVPAYRCRVAYIAQRPGIFAGTVEDNLRLPFTLTQHRQRQFNRNIVVNLLEAVSRPASFLDKPARDLSGGEAQLMNLLRVMQLDPAILLLDEPTSALDAQATAMVESLVVRWAERNAAETATLWVTHDSIQARRVGNRFFRMANACLEELADASAVDVASMQESGP